MYSQKKHPKTTPFQLTQTTSQSFTSWQHLSLANQPKAGSRSLQINIMDWLREITQNYDASTNPNDAVKVTSASIPPAGHPVAIHSSQQFSCGWYQTQHSKRSVSTYRNDVALPPRLVLQTIS
ncbi:hypothetical protein F511_33679 [Dorcoceras hygrometricum]|uniref:Uncharacterized protein n=1 Tax=Dorcoceras hygrometricum TaxID=472368 RepID=A0A2Z7A9Q1_9LAMI|nr:hypothetical protein F511_33679 [Dorcoceras hygrometricum]